MCVSVVRGFGDVRGIWRQLGGGVSARGVAMVGGWGFP
jgi:hypothetical protein